MPEKQNIRVELSVLRELERQRTVRRVLVIVRILCWGVLAPLLLYVVLYVVLKVVLPAWGDEALGDSAWEIVSSVVESILAFFDSLIDTVLNR